MADANDPETAQAAFVLAQTSLWLMVKAGLVSREDVARYIDAGIERAIQEGHTDAAGKLGLVSKMILNQRTRS